MKCIANYARNVVLSFMYIHVHLGPPVGTPAVPYPLHAIMEGGATPIDPSRLLWLLVWSSAWEMRKDEVPSNHSHEI